MAVDIVWKPYKYRSFNDGITIFSVDISVDFYKGDHSPGLNIFLDILNFRLISIEVYNTLHEDQQ